jgi:uncharacterized membrane protein YdbT with pleckstrin-like domain
MGLFASKRSDYEVHRPDGTAQSVPPAVHPSAAASFSSRQEIPIPKDLMDKHEESLGKYPRVHLSKGEYVVMEVRRHPIGLISIWLSMGLLIVATLALIPLYAMNRAGIASTLAFSADKMPSDSAVTLLLLALAALFLLGGFVAMYVYNSNLFYLTNESIIQYVQPSIFSTKEQQINLVNIDDVSYRQQGILQQVLNYGTVRVSTEGDERNPYVFYFVARPQLVVRTINDSMEEATGFAVRFRQHKANIDSDPTLPPPEQF